MPPHDTPTIDGTSIYSFYRELGIEFPAWANRQAAVRCFADPDAHRHGDRHPSCSISVEHGAWHCHGCGANGGPYDAATSLGYSPRAAIDLMVRHGLTHRRDSHHLPPALGTRRQRSPTRRQAAAAFSASEQDVRRWQQALADQPDLIGKLTRERGWLYSTMLELELGYDCGRITIPVRDEHQDLLGLLRYRPWPQASQAKMLAVQGSRRCLTPHPSKEPSMQVLLVEGEPDMIAARSRGLPAIAVPGVEAWRPEWAPLLAGREVTIVMDCDRAGRRAASRISQDLCKWADPFALDIAPSREDGYDLTDLFHDHPRAAAGHRSGPEKFSRRPPQAQPAARVPTQE